MTVWLRAVSPFPKHIVLGKGGMCQQPSPEHGVRGGLQGSLGLSSVPGTGSRVNYVLGVKKPNITHKNYLLSPAAPTLDRDLAAPAPCCSRLPPNDSKHGKMGTRTSPAQGRALHGHCPDKKGFTASTESTCESKARNRGPLPSSKGRRGTPARLQVNLITNSNDIEPQPKHSTSSGSKISVL